LVFSNDNLLLLIVYKSSLIAFNDDKSLPISPCKKMDLVAHQRRLCVVVDNALSTTTKLGVVAPPFKTKMESYQQRLKCRCEYG